MQKSFAAPSDYDQDEPKANVLLVDDAPANLLALEAILDGLGYHLVKVASGEEALQRLQELNFAVVLLDVRMHHGIDGFETAKRIRSQERSRNTPMIFLTAHESDEFPTLEAYKLGAVDYLVKPILPEILRAKVAGFVGLFEEKERAKRQADELRLLIQGTRDYAIFMLDPEGHIVSWNAGAERIKGYAPEEVIGQHFSRFYPQEAIDRGWPQEELRRALADGQFEDEGWRLRKDGSRFWANVVLTALKDDAGQLRGFSKVTRDLTERKQREVDLLQLHRDLERRVQERTAALEASNEALQVEIAERTRAEEALRQSDRLKDQFVIMLAHELRNPLAPLRMGLHILGASDGDRQAVQKIHGMMERQVGHLSRIIEDLLDVARIMRGRVTLRTERLDLGQLVRVVLDDYFPALEQAGLTVEMSLPTLPTWIMGDATRLTQVLDNLLQNTVKYTDRGGKVVVRVSADEAGRFATLTVRDNGIGIEPALLSHLFEAFTQADRSLDRAKGGLGLGLTVVKGLIELHGGNVQASSAGPGQGAEFVIQLPLQPEPAALAYTPASVKLPPARLRVLVVEDNQDAADSLRMLLEIFGYEVAVAYSGPTGVKTAENWQPDVVLCDIGLPGMDGYAVAGALRQNPSTSKVRMIAVTGYGGEEDRRRSQEAGFDAHLTKPADPAALQKLLAKS